MTVQARMTSGHASLWLQAQAVVLEERIAVLDPSHGDFTSVRNHFGPILPGCDHACGADLWLDSPGPAATLP